MAEQSISAFEDAIRNLGFQKLEIERFQLLNGKVQFAFGISGRQRITWTHTGKAFKRGTKTPAKGYDLKF